MSPDVRIVESEQVSRVTVTDDEVTIVSVEGGPAGPPGPPGPAGAPGAPGAGVPTGGVADDLLVKQSGTDYDTAWADEVTVDRLGFDTGAGETVGEGEVAWNATDGTLDVGMLGGNVTQQVGMEQYVRARHDLNAGITEGLVYYLSGASGAVKEVLPAQADQAATCKTTVGVAAETVAGGGQALLTTFGLVRGLPDALFTNVTEGSVVYLSAVSPGGLTSTPPAAPDHRVVVGFCVRKQSNNNDLFVKVQTGLDVDELCDVVAGSPGDGDVLAFDSVAGVWENRGSGVPVGGTTGQVLAKTSNTDYDTGWVAQSGGGIVTPAMPHAVTSWPSGTYVANGTGAYTTFGGTGTGTFIVPFFLVETTTFDRIGCQVTVAGSAGATVDLAIYNTDGEQPTTVLYESPSGIAADTTGTKEDTISVTLQAGLWGLAFRRSAGLTIRAFAFDGAPALAALPGDSRTSNLWFQNAFPFPDPFAGAFSSAVATVPAIFLRVA